MKKRTLGVQALEMRALLAIDVSLDALSGELYIGGTAGDDTVEVSSDQVNVRAKLTTAGSSETITYPALLVRSIRFVGREGDDQFTNNTSLPSTAYGQDGNDVLISGSGVDNFWGGAGDDSLQGNSGDDTLRGESGSDMVEGGDGNDRLYGGDGDDVLRGGNENDSIYGDAGLDAIYGDAGNDDLYGGDQRDLLDGGVGDDIVRGGYGHDKLLGGDGSDQIFGDLGNDYLLGEGGNDWLYGQAGEDILKGGTGDDYLDGAEDDDTLYGEVGNDILLGREGNDLIFGGAGDDQLRGFDGDDDLQGEDGDDQIFGEAGKDSLRGGAGNDILDGGSENDSINGNDGSDTIDGRQGDDVLVGGSGNDTIHGGPGLDRMSGQDGDDALYGDEDADILLGGRDADLLSGGDAVDLLIGGEGLDTLRGNGDRDLLIGGTTAYDESANQLRTVLNNWMGDPITESTDAPALFDSSAVSLRPNETVYTDGSQDILAGDDGQDWFFWFAGDSIVDQSTDEFVTGGDVSATGWVSRIYLDILGRMPTAAELQSVLDRIAEGRAPETLAQQILRSEDGRKTEIRRAYRTAFGTEISSAELGKQLTLWNQGPVGIDGAWASLLGSVEFRAARGGTDRGVVSGMFSVLLRRSPTDAEMNTWLEVLAEMAPEEAAYQFVASTENIMARASDWYREYLHRPATAGELLDAVNQIQGHVPSTAYRAGLMASAEYRNQPYFSATDAGATPNDNVSDTVALQTLLDVAGLAGSSMIYLAPGTYFVENLRLYGSNVKFVGPGTLKLVDRSSAVGVLTVLGDQNLVADLAIDANAGGRPTGRAEGLRVFGTGNWVRNVVAMDAVYDEATAASGINFIVGGKQNTLEQTQSLRAGYTGYRQIGQENLYLNITSINARIKGFNATGNGSSFTVDGGYFATNAPEHELGVVSFQVDPGPNRYIAQAVLRNVTVMGPDNSAPHTTNAAKFALVRDLTIENSSFLSESENIDSIRFAEGMGNVTMRDVFLSRQIFMQQNTNDGSGLDDPMDSLYMERVTIGDGRHHPAYSMERVRVGSLTIIDSKFIGYTVAGIAWESPNSEFSRVIVQNTVFQGWNANRATYDILFLNGGATADRKRFTWSGNGRSNTGGGGAQFTQP